jgi:hypothetical protein
MDVICFDFVVPQLLSILQNKKMMSGSNLVLDPNNPLAMYKPQDNRLGEALSGSVYQDMYRRLVSNPSKQLLCPLICCTNGTQIDALSRFSVEPFLFTPAVLSHAARCKSDGWKLLNDALVTKKTNLTKVLESLEALSCFDAWSRMDKFWKLSQLRNPLLEC